MEIKRYKLDLTVVPVDFFADPDGDWNYFDLVEAAGFDPETDGACVGALTDEFRGHPAGSAVVTVTAKNRPYLAIIECDPMAAQASSDEDVRAA